jgi:hypothetical protein
VKSRFTKDFLKKSPFTKNEKVVLGPLDKYLSVGLDDFDADSRGGVDA